MFQRSAFASLRTINKCLRAPAFSTASVPQLIKELRKATGAPIMECRKALNAENNDYEKATEWLRKNGSAKAASKVAGRDACEGLIGIAIDNDGGKGSLVRVASETDFASRSEDFTNFVETVAKGALVESDPEGLMKVENNGKTVKDALDDAILAIRENLNISNVDTIAASSEDSFFAGYVHGKVFSKSNAGTSGAIVELVPKNADISKEAIAEVGKKLAMHIVAAKPSYQGPADVPTDVIEKEKGILMEQLADSGKPSDILEKIVNGRMRKYYEGICLTEQGHMLEEGSPKVGKVLKDVGVELVTFKSNAIQ